MNFAVFKSPTEGRTHVFRPGEPFAQIIVIPEESEFELVEMDEEEAAERELQSRRIREPRYAVRGYPLDFIHQHSLRRNLSPLAERGEGEKQETSLARLAPRLPELPLVTCRAFSWPSCSERLPPHISSAGYLKG